MNAAAIPSGDQRTWGFAAATAVAAHVGAAALVLLWVRPPAPSVPEPVMLIELPAQAAPAPTVAAQQPETQPQPDYTPPMMTPAMTIRPVQAPLPKDPVVLPPPSPPVSVRQTSSAAPLQPAAAAPAVSSPVGSGTGSSVAPSSDPKAKRAEADYFSLISAHLNRRKTYPTDAKKARQEGVVTIRFTVSRDGGVSNISLRRSSGHDILDAATLDLLRRVAPLPRMPASMSRDSITLSLPIEYALRTN